MGLVLGTSQDRRGSMSQLGTSVINSYRLRDSVLKANISWIFPVFLYTGDFFESLWTGPFTVNLKYWAQRTHLARQGVALPLYVQVCSLVPHNNRRVAPATSCSGRTHPNRCGAPSRIDLPEHCTEHWLGQPPSLQLTGLNRDDGPHHSAYVTGTKCV